MIITIPTHMRESEKEQITIKRIPESLYKDVYFFTDENRVDLLKKVIPKKCNIIPVPSELGNFGISGKRQFIVDWSNRNGFKKIWQIDDNLRFMKNVGLHPTLKKGPQLLTASKEEFKEFFEYVKQKLDEYILIGNLNRSGTYQERIESENVYEDKENRRIYSSIAINIPLFIKNEIRFDFLQKKFNDNELSLMEDYSVLLQILTKGLKTLQIGKFCFDKVSFTNKGGCSIERNRQRQIKVVKALMRTFPELCELVYSKDKTKKETVGVNIKIFWNKIKSKKENSLENFFI